MSNRTISMLLPRLPLPGSQAAPGTHDLSAPVVPPPSQSGSLALPPKAKVHHSTYRLIDPKVPLPYMHLSEHVSDPRAKYIGGYGLGAVCSEARNAPYRPFEGTWGPQYRLAGAPHGVDLLVEPFNQNVPHHPETGALGPQSNSGTTSLAMLMHHFRPGSPGSSQPEIDHALQRGETQPFTNPAEIAVYVAGQGYTAASKNDASLGDIKASIDQGVPVQVIMEPLRNHRDRRAIDPHDRPPHYAVVSGYEQDRRGRIKTLVLSDPRGMYFTMPVEDFQPRWNNQPLPGRKADLNNFMLTIVPKTGTIAAPSGQPLAPTQISQPITRDPADPFWIDQLKAGGQADLRNAIANPFRGEAFGLGVSGLFKTWLGTSAQMMAMMGLPKLGGLVAHGGVFLGDLAEKASANLGYALGTGIRPVIHAAAKGGSAIKHAAAEVGSGFGSAIGSVGHAVAKVGSAIGAVGTAVAGVGLAIGSTIGAVGHAVVQGAVEAVTLVGEGAQIVGNGLAAVGKGIAGFFGWK